MLSTKLEPHGVSNCRSPSWLLTTCLLASAAPAGFVLISEKEFGVLEVFRVVSDDGSHCDMGFGVVDEGDEFGERPAGTALVFVGLDESLLSFGACIEFAGADTLSSECESGLHSSLDSDAIDSPVFGLILCRNGVPAAGVFTDSEGTS